MNKTLKTLWALVLMVSLVACGGGGGGGSNPPPPADTTLPVISLVGPATVTVEAGTPYVDQGATATDNVDGNIPTASIAVNCNVNTAIVGTYSCTYNVSDSSGNPAVQVTRTVNVVDTVGPSISIPGANPDSVVVGNVYTPPTATAIDTVDGARPVSMSGTVNTAVVGGYTLTYSSTDSRGNTSSVDLVVNVIPVPDTTPPVITPVGADPQIVYVGDTFVPLGATATDDTDGNITANIVTNCNVNTATAGVYSCTYNVSDSSGNPATQVTRTVNVVAVPTLTTGKIFYPGYDEAQKLLNGGDGAIYTQDLSTSVMTRLWGGYQCLPGCAVMFPEVIVPARNGNLVASQGGNLDGIHLLNLTTLVDEQVVAGQIDWAPTCSSWAQGSFDITADAGQAVFSSRCHPVGLPEYRDIVLMKLDNSMFWVRVTDDTFTELSPAICGEDATTTSVCFLSNKSGSYDIWKQVVDKATGNLVGAQTLMVSNAVDGVRAMSFSSDYSQFVFMRMVGGQTHVIVKTLAGGAEVDLGLGRDPYWSTNGNNLIMYTAGSPGVRYAIHPDGTGKVVVPIPANVSASVFYGAAACGDTCLGNMVFPAAGY